MSAGLAKTMRTLGARAAGGLAALAMAFVAVSHGAESADPVKLRFGGDMNETRMVLEAPRAVQADPKEPDAGKLELAFSQLPLDADENGQGRGLIKAWSLKRGLGGARLTLDLARGAKIKRRFLLPPADGVSVYRYVVDLEADGAPSAPARPAPVRKALPPVAIPAADPVPPAPAAKGPLIKAVAESPRAKKVVVIDPGHGGHDPGALGDRAQEKDITLAAAKALKAKLEKTGRFKIVLTRSSDVFVPLETRVQIARQAGADLFISLHADSGADPGVHGATVYTLSDQGVDRAARGVFASGSFLNVKLPGRDLGVKQILLDLTQRNTRNRSSAFAEQLIDTVGRQTDLVSRSHRDAGYVVLLAPDVPAVLLEMGFITNHHDETDLMDLSHRTRLMGAVGDAIEAYFDQPPVPVAH